MKEIENKALIFLSAMETSVRRLVKDKDSKNIAQIIEERADLLENNLNFAIVRVMVRDGEGTVIDHTHPDKIGQTTASEDFQQVMDTGRPLIKHKIKTFRAEPGQPEIPVIEALYPIKHRQKGDIQAVIKIIISVERSLELIKEEYQKHSRRAVIGFTVAAILLVSGSLIFIRRKIILPILSIEEGAAQVASGNLETQVVATGNNEISSVTQSFNTMVEGLKHRDQMRQSLAVAKEVQQRLLPASAPDIKGIDIAGTTLYCDETGGDYFDYLEWESSPAERLGVVIGDVSGHGIPAALLMTTARAFLRQRSALTGSPAEIISDVNSQLTRDVGDSGSFMSMFYLIIDKGSKQLAWVRAGHDPALFYDPANDVITELKGHGIALGVDESWQYEENHLADLSADQIIVLGTDGIWEARNPDGDMFGKDTLAQLIKNNTRLDAQSILNEIATALLKFRNKRVADDDVTIIVIKMTAEFEATN